MSGKKTLLLLIAILLLTSCSVGDPFSSNDAITTLVLQFSNLPPLENNFHYEGWAVIANEDKSIGKFKIHPNGSITDIEGVAVPEGRIGTEFDVAEATLIKVSIEEAGDVNTTPSGSFILAGAVSGFSAVLSINHEEAIGKVFSTSSAQYLLATPSTTDTLDEKSGIWFIEDMNAVEPTPGIDAPDLEGGWVYEGWVTFGDTTLTIGQFELPGAGDSSDEFTGTEPIPFLPGEDFVRNAPPGLTFPTDLSSLTITITLEPEKDDNRNGPSQFLLFSGSVPETAEKHVTYPLVNFYQDLPSGVIALVKDDENK